MLEAKAVLGRIPEIHRFPAIDELLEAFAELAGRHPQLFRMRRIGTSRLGEPLMMLSAGTGPLQALLVGGPHPNEPVGFLTLLHAAHLLADDAHLRDGLGYTWNLIPCIDPDAARLNEGWYAGPLTIDHYHRHFYRPALGNQPEWTFPVFDDHAYFDRTLPETQALMRVIDELRPQFQYALHNADFGGAYFVVSQNPPGLAEKLMDAVEVCEIPLELNPSETAGWPVAGPGVFVMPPADDMITHQGRDNGPRPHGGSSSHYAARHGTLTLITEAPMWAAVQPAAGTAEIGRPYAHVIRAKAADLRRQVGELEEAVRRVTPELRTSSVFAPAVADTLAIGRAYVRSWEAAAEAPGAAGRPVTAAELASAELTVWRTPLRATAMLRRLLRVECAAGNHRPVLRAELKATEDRLTRACAHAADRAPISLLPLRNLVALQLTAALTAIAHLPGIAVR
jgi:hypothetical protein